MKVLSCRDGDNLEEECCCWVKAAVKNGDIRYGHTYIFDPVENPVIAARLNGGPSEVHDTVKTQIWIRRGKHKDSAAGWERYGSAPLPRYPNNQIHTGVAVAAEGTVTGVQFGTRNWPTDTSQIAICSPFNPQQIKAGEVKEISSKPGEWKKDAQKVCTELTTGKGCTVGSIAPFHVPEPVGSVPCWAAAAAPVAWAAAWKL